MSTSRTRPSRERAPPEVAEATFHDALQPGQALRASPSDHFGQLVDRREEVAESAAYPVPSQFGEEEIAIAITHKPGTELSAADVVAACRENLPHFAVPRYVRFLDELPKTETGKIQKFKLKKLGTAGATECAEERR